MAPIKARQSQHHRPVARGPLLLTLSPMTLSRLCWEREERTGVYIISNYVVTSLFIRRDVYICISTTRGTKSAARGKVLSIGERYCTITTTTTATTQRNMVFSSPEWLQPVDVDINTEACERWVLSLPCFLPDDWDHYYQTKLKLTNFK